MQSMSGVLAIPLEIIEDVLVFLAIDGEFTSISSFAQTCRRLRQFIYDPTDKHLWHRIFLTAFDDPHANLGSSDDLRQSFDWGAETRRRIRASLRLKPRPSDTDPDPRVLIYRLRSEECSAAIEGDETVDYTTHLLTLLSLIDTVAPLPRSSAPPREAITDPKDSPFTPTMSLAEADARSPLHPPVVEGLWGSHRSQNIFWLYSVLNRGLPLILPCRFAHSRLDKAWLSSDESHALHKVIALFGIQPLLNAHPSGNQEGHDWSWRSKDRFQWLQLQEQGRRDLALRLCQSRVFHIDYPSARRCWGPFLPVDRPTTRSRFRVSRAGHGPIESDDEDYFPPTERKIVPPPADKLYPDWVHLSAIRVVVEGCLRSDVVFHDILGPLTTWHALRPGFWVPPAPEEEPSNKYERDWAGVEGVWQRCVVWLDYDSLVTQNYVGFGSQLEPIDEVVIIVPLTMRIVGYSPSSVPGYEHLPTIHFEGQMGGALWDIEQDTRRTHGFVSVLADGSIRWSMFSSHVGDPDEDEWASEGVQLGGIGSRSGVIGMWTGATHEPHTDPIGGWWQWRVT